MSKKSHNKIKSLNISKGVEQPSYLNVQAINRIKQRKTETYDLLRYVEGITSGDRTILGQAITIIESSLNDHNELGQKIIEKCLPYTGNSLRIGITGTPGVGKSTFIEALGSMIINKGRKVAVLAIDPSSEKTKGSILGDKTRMLNLSSEESAFIRPSPSSGTLGGVARKTREAVYLCEAAGYDTILIETIGVGQSETAVHSMVDFFLLLMLSGAGDELQGIKRGVVELADLLVINKADDTFPEKIELTKRDYVNAIELFPITPSGWIPRVESCSSTNNDGIENIWEIIEEYFIFAKQKGFFEEKRKDQSRYWLYETINAELTDSFFRNKDISDKLNNLEKEIVFNKKSPFSVASELLKIHHRHRKSD